MDELAAKEKDKYERMWSNENYGVTSPGDKAIQLFTNYEPLPPLASITDYGAGNCKAAMRMAQKGLRVQVVDIAIKTACQTLELCGPLFRLGVHEQCLWAMRGVQETDYAFCADVMEHIPPEKVDSVLKAIERRTRKTAAFLICHRPDGCGRLIGETLHLTVESSAWWKAKLEKLYSHVTALTQEDGTFYLCRK